MIKWKDFCVQKPKLEASQMAFLLATTGPLFSDVRNQGHVTTLLLVRDKSIELRIRTYVHSLYSFTQ